MGRRTQGRLQSSGPWRSSIGSDIRILRPSPRRLETVDGNWGTRRPPEQSNMHWSWKAIGKRAKVLLALVDSQDETLALWAGKADVAVASKHLFRLDYFEIAPQHRGSLLGIEAFSIAASLACREPCDGMILASLPEAVSWYERAGAQRGVRGWEAPPGLTALTFDKNALTRLSQASASLEIDHASPS